jgi:hypothetical protein
MIQGQQRVSFTGETVAYVGQHQLACTACALSIAGMILLPPASARAGLQMRLVLKLVEIGKQVVVDAVLANEVWEQGRYAWEVQFVGMSDAVRDLFARFVVARLNSAGVPTMQVEAVSPLQRVPTGPYPAITEERRSPNSESAPIQRVPTGPLPRVPTGPQPRGIFGGAAAHIPTNPGVGLPSQKSSPGFYASGRSSSIEEADLSRTLTGVGDVAAGKRTAGPAPASATRKAASMKSTATRATMNPSLSTKRTADDNDVLEDVSEESGVRRRPSDMDSEELRKYQKNPRRLEELYMAAIEDLDRPTGKPK